MQYNIAPTDLTFLLNDCHACFWRKVKLRKPRPYTPFPGVFMAIDKAMRNAYKDCHTSIIDPSLPPGFLDSKERKLESAPIAVKGRGSSIVFGGKPEAIAYFEDGTHGIPDFKTSNPKDEHIRLYSRQMHCCRDILQQPSKGASRVVTHLGLICETPVEMTIHDSKTHLFRFQPTYVPIMIDENWWMNFLGEVVDLLDGAEPASSPKCHYCDAYKWQELQKTGLQINFGVPHA